jgi:parallel beta-helix repeat protein
MNYRRAFAFLLLSALFLTACDSIFDHPLKPFFEEQTGTITVKEAAPENDRVALGTDGYVCLAPGIEGFSIPIDNPIGYDLTIETSFTPTLGAEISGITVTRGEVNSLTVHIPGGTVPGNEGTLHIQVKTAKEGRLLYEGDMNIACVDFNVRLSALTPSSPVSLLEDSFDPDGENYHIGDAPASFALLAEAENPAATVSINGESGRGSLNRLIVPPMGNSDIVIRVEAPHGAGFRDYTIEMNRTFLGIAIQTEPSKKVYGLQSSPNTGLEAGGMVVIDHTSSTALDPNQYTLAYDFTSPGSKTVAVSYKGSTAAFIVWVVGLAGLGVSVPGGYTAELDFNPASAAVYDKNLGILPYAVDTLSITAVSAVADIEGASLSVRRTAPSGSGGPVQSGATAQVSLVTGSAGDGASLPLNTIEIKVGIDREGTINDVSRTYILKATRAKLANGAEFFVSETGDDNGDGSEEHPFATVRKALALVNNSGLESMADTFITITIAGTITAVDTGYYGMVEILGSGYPKKIILRGKGTGTEAGVLDAAGKNRVLYIAGNTAVIMEDNLTLTGGSVINAWPGGGVYAEDRASSFTMNGGTIEGNSTESAGGGICAAGKFTMTGGIIRNNTGDGGVYMSGSSTFIMTGGTIENNTGGGVRTSGDFTLSGNAIIQGNTASAPKGGGGVFAGNGASFTMSENSIIRGNDSFNSGGGGVSVYNGSTFSMTGGTIEGNTAKSSYPYGGGVYVSSNSTFTMTGGTVRGNSAKSGGGGIYVAGTSVFTLSGNAVIQNNTDESSSNSGSAGGGGIHLSASTFTMSGNAVIRDNASPRGGGVFVSHSTFTMSGGTIRGNTASGEGGGGVCLNHYMAATFIKKGSAVIYGDIDTDHTPESAENTAASGSGHGIYLKGGDKKRNADTGANLDLYVYLYEKDNSVVWIYVDPAVGGVGDTAENWE